MLHQTEIMCVALTQPTRDLGKKWSESNQVLFFFLLCGVCGGGGEPHLQLLHQTADIICTFSI